MHKEVWILYINSGHPKTQDLYEPMRIAKAISKLNLNHVVITSVDRDDLSDGGASQFVNCIKEIRKLCSDTTIEVLTPDFQRKEGALEQIISAEPDVFNHNLETISRLYKTVRRGANYKHSLYILKKAKKLKPNIFTKSGIMVGLGESIQEISKLLDDLKNADVDFITIGQYLQPSVKHHPLERYYHPDEFKELELIAKSKGFLLVSSSPLTRSSYHADEDFAKLKKNRLNLN